jgi:ribosomal protein S18 acetylase RimI-like enzyme
MTYSLRIAQASDAASLSRLAAATFALACPDGTPQEDIRSYIESELTEASFLEHIACSTKSMLVTLVDSVICGYMMLCREEAPSGVAARRPIELRRIYVLPQHHGSGVADSLVMRAIREAGAGGYGTLWLGVSASNVRALCFYRRHGFTTSGACRFPLGGIVHEGLLMSRDTTENDSIMPSTMR